MEPQCRYLFVVWPGFAAPQNEQVLPPWLSVLQFGQVQPRIQRMILNMASFSFALCADD